MVNLLLTAFISVASVQDNTDQSGNASSVLGVPLNIAICAGKMKSFAIKKFTERSIRTKSQLARGCTALRIRNGFARTRKRTNNDLRGASSGVRDDGRSGTAHANNTIHTRVIGAGETQKGDERTTFKIS